jgi:hypothetical protein
MLLALDLMSAAAASDVQGFYKKTIQELIYKWHNIDMKMLSPFLSSLKEGVSSRISARNKTPTQQAASFSKFWLLLLQFLTDHQLIAIIYTFPLLMQLVNNNQLTFLQYKTLEIILP